MAPKTWAKGDRVVQPTYGAGTILEYNEHHVVIEFDQSGKKTFSTRLVTLQTTNEPAPAKAARKRAPRKVKAKKVEAAEEE
jgi:hypothetical protein